MFYQVLRITVSSVHDGHHALVLGAIALAFRCRQILVSTVRCLRVKGNSVLQCR